MTSVGPAVCRSCGQDVLLLPTASGALEAVDRGLYPLEQVAEGDRYVLLAHQDLAVPAEAPPGQATCLRRHQCEPLNAVVIPSESPRADHPSVATRRDFQDLRELRTRAELLRLQALGRLRKHPGSRHYSPTDVIATFARLTHLDAEHCVLCRRSLGDRDKLTVATVNKAAEDAPTDDRPPELYVCMPGCPQLDGHEGTSTGSDT